MRFGLVAVRDAEGCLLAHSLKHGELVLRKGHRLGAADLERLAAAGIAAVGVARLDAGDVPEDQAAQDMATALAGAGCVRGAAATGRANLFAAQAGLARIDAARIHAANAVHESLTVATLPDATPVAAGQMLATIKVIPYAAPRTALEQLLSLMQGSGGAISVAGWCRLGVGLVLTRLPDTRAAVLTKMRSAVEKRLEPLQARLQAETVVTHEAGAVATAIAQLAAQPGVDAVLVSGIVAAVDRADVVPAGIEAAGGRVLHAGMPVDPGNLLLLGSLPRGATGCPLVGIPTCARSPRLNGFDFVLRRLAAGLDVTPGDITAMGVGGLLGEIPSRPMPRRGV